MNKKITKCRISGSDNLISVLDIGNQYLTGIFPKSKNEKISKGNLELLWCPESGLLQLGHSYDLDEMYGMNYGYRSGLNAGMVKHLQNKIFQLEKKYAIQSGDIALDIGSNDSTLLQSYNTSNLKRIGIDPTGVKFSQYYPKEISLVSDFFNKKNFLKASNNKHAKFITSIAMFYDLEKPNDFVADIASSLDKNGIWHFEQSYMPAMLRTNSYDTVCHEHLEYYSLEVVDKLLKNNGLEIIDVEMNAVNGGSFAVTASHKNGPYKKNQKLIEWLLDQEDRLGLSTPKPYREFEEKVFRHREDLTRLIKALNADNKKIFGYGASTKGNVLLQFCGLTEKDIPYIAEVNKDKFGSYTPGSLIPIISEQEARDMQPDYFLVLPWHFKNSILEREKEFRDNGGKFIFPLPEIEII